MQKKAASHTNEKQPFVKTKTDTVCMEIFLFPCKQCKIFGLHVKISVTKNPYQLLTCGSRIVRINYERRMKNEKNVVCDVSGGDYSGRAYGAGEWGRLF